MLQHRFQNHLKMFMLSTKTYYQWSASCAEACDQYYMLSILGMLYLANVNLVRAEALLSSHTNSKPETLHEIVTNKWKRADCKQSVGTSRSRYGSLQAVTTHLSADEKELHFARKDEFVIQRRNIISHFLVNEAIARVSLGHFHELSSKEVAVCMLSLHIVGIWWTLIS